MAGNVLKLHYHDHFRPCNDVVFTIMNGRKELFVPLVSAIVGEPIELIGDPITQAEKRERSALLNKIRFDAFGFSTNSRYYTTDMQRTYKGERVKRRIVYYACRVISTQEVEKMRYESLKGVTISFIFTDDKTDRPVRFAGMLYKDTHEEYDDLLNVAEVYIPAVIRSDDKSSVLYMFARFYSISSQDDADIFVDEFTDNDLAKELMRVYNSIVADANQLYELEQDPYFTQRLTEAQLDEERTYARNQGIRLGMDEGIQVGRSEGIQVGRDEGIIIGRDEERVKADAEKRAMIINLLDLGIPADTVAKAARTTPDEVLIISQQRRGG